MSKLEMVKQVPDEQKHTSDAEGVTTHGGKVYTCADDGMIKVFDLDLNLVKEFKAHDYAVYDVMVFGGNLFTCGVDSLIKVWDMNTFELKKTVEKHEESVRKFATNGILIFAGDEQGDVRGYNEEGEVSVFYNVVEEVWSLNAKDDFLYSVRDRGVTITQLRGEDNKYIHVQSLEGRAPIYIHGDRLVFPDNSGQTLEVRDNNKSSKFALKGQLKGTEMIMTAVGGWGDNRVVSGGWDAELRLWDLTNFTEIGKCKLPDAPNAIAATEQGDIFVVGSGGFICKLKGS